MRLLIGSDGPAALGAQSDIRAWTERILWFAEDGDIVVLMDDPDPAYIDHVTGLTGVDPSTLRIHVVPSRWIGGNFDAWALLNASFQDDLLVDAAAVTEVIALWPNPEVGWLAESLGLESKLPGAAFWREGGGILANSKALFRAIAGGAGVPVPPGGVCRSIDDAFHLSGHLVRAGHDVMVKRSYAGGGAGNEIVSRQGGAFGHAGHAAAEPIDATANSLRSYWERRWWWASADGAHPVIVEAYVPDARTLYVEVRCTDDGVGPGQVGELAFEQGRIAREIFPAQRVADAVRAVLESAAHRLAEVYAAMGYRGRLSLDSVVVPDGHIYFTEANARFTGSTHLYDQIAGRVARVAESPPRVVVQTLTPASSPVASLEALLSQLVRHGAAFDPSTRRGVLAVTPVVHGSRRVVLATVAESEEAAAELVGCLGP